MLITYHYECEDKSKKYDCPHCPDWFVRDEDYGTESDESYTEESSWGWEGEDYVRRPAEVKSPVKRRFRSWYNHFSHILLGTKKRFANFY